MLIGPFISSIEDTASVLYKGRAVFLRAPTIEDMDTDAWRARLEVAIVESGRSKRDISLASGYGPGYVHSITTEGKDPSVIRLMAICDNLNVSGMYVLYGVDIKPDDLEILQEMQNKPNSREGILSIIKSAAS